MTCNDPFMWGWSYGSDGMDTSRYNPITLIFQIDSFKNLGLIYGSYGVISCLVVIWKGLMKRSGVVCHL